MRTAGLLPTIATTFFIAALAFSQEENAPAFRKIKLAPGEEKEVTFTIRKDALSFFDADKHEWVAEPGKFEAIIAASAADIKGKVPFELK